MAPKLSESFTASTFQAILLNLLMLIHYFVSHLRQALFCVEIAYSPL